MKINNLFIILFLFIALIGCNTEETEDLQPVDTEESNNENDDDSTSEEEGEEDEDEDDTTPPADSVATETADLTIFFVNDQHGSINNFAKVKAIVDESRVAGNTLLVSSGDVFSGNPVVDQYSDRGYPMIDIMNEVGFEVAVYGNHEFDYGIETLKDRVEQSEFPWIVANMYAANSVLEQPDPYVTLTVGEYKITFLGLIETFGKEGDVIPATHPQRVTDLTFYRHYDVVDNYANLKETEDADLYVGLTHLGSRSDRRMAESFTDFDLIIGGHSHEETSDIVRGTPIYQAGAYLNLLGKIEIDLEDKEVVDIDYTMIDLNEAEEEDANIAALISEYNNNPELYEVIGQAEVAHDRFNLGCFFTTALKEYMDVDFTIQNNGGIRANIDEGPITKYEIYSMDPFNNKCVTFTKTVGEFENFFCETGAFFHYAGLTIDTSNGDFQITDEGFNPLPDDQELTIGLNDYIPSVNDSFFDFDDAEIKDYTSAEAIIAYLEEIESTIDDADCVRTLQCPN